MDKYFKIASHGLIKKGDKFLVTRRALVNDYMPGFWDIPGGTIEFGEDTVDALKREIQEEVNLEVEPGKILFAYGYVSSSVRHQFQLVYECEYLSGEIKLNPEEHDEFKWVNLSDIGSLKKIAFLENLYKELGKEING